MLVLMVVSLVGCTERDVPVGELAVKIDKRDPDRLMRFYMGAIDGSAGDSLLVATGRSLTLRSGLIAASTGYEADLNSDGTLDWDELVALVSQTYNREDRLPPTRADLEAKTAYRDTTGSFIVELHGTMTTALRRIFVPRAALQSALLSAEVDDPRIVYPAATTIVGEHWSGNALVETTAMIKRIDGFWDFVVYDEGGGLADSTSTEPRSLQSPTQCAGCHFGSRAFEPEKSYPAAPSPGPDGPRGIVSPAVNVDSDVVTLFDEHRRRSDTVLGMYATLYVGRLLETRQLQGRLQGRDAEIIQRLFPNEQ